VHLVDLFCDSILPFCEQFLVSAEGSIVKCSKHTRQSIRLLTKWKLRRSGVTVDACGASCALCALSSRMKRWLLLLPRTLDFAITVMSVSTVNSEATKATLWDRSETPRSSPWRLRRSSIMHGKNSRQAKLLDVASRCAWLICYARPEIADFAPSCTHAPPWPAFLRLTSAS